MVKKVVKRVKPIYIDDFSTNAIRALYRKLHRDYLKFFRSLGKIYKTGELKKEADAAARLVLSTIRLMDTGLKLGNIKKEDVNDIVANVDVLNAQRDFFLKQAQELEPVREKIEEIETESGVSPEDLNITEATVRRVGKRAMRPPREGVLPFLKRTAPRTTALAGELGKGAAAAAFGPFLPVAGMAAGAVKDIFGVGRGIAQKVRAGRERKLEARLRPAVSGLPEEGYERIGRARGGYPFGGMVGGISKRAPLRRSKEEMVSPLVYFFNRKADKVKWTKDVLKKLKDIEKSKRAAGMGFLSGLKTSFLALGATLLPLIAKGAGFAALAIGVGHAIYQFNRLRKVWAAFTKSKEAAGEAGARAGRAARQKAEYIKEVGIKEYAKRAGKTEKQVALDIVGLEQREALGKMVARPWYMKTAHALGLAKRPEIAPTPTYERVGELTRELTKKGAPAAPAAPAVEAKSVDNLTSAVKSLEETFTEQADTPPTRNVGLGNIYDSGDVLLNEHASGSLTIQGD